MISIPLKNGGILLFVKLLKPIQSEGFQTRPDIDYDDTVLGNNDFVLETWDEADGYAEQTGNQKQILTYSPYLLDDSTDCSTVCIRLSQSETNHTVWGVTAKDIVTGANPWSDNFFTAHPSEARTQLAELDAANLPANIDFLLKCLKNRKEVAKNGLVWELIVYDDDNTTPILTKALKDKDAADITDLLTGNLAYEEKTTV